MQGQPPSTLEPSQLFQTMKTPIADRKYCQQKYEAYLRKTAPFSTYDRYTRALEKFFSYFPEKKNVWDFLRCHVEDYKVLRKREGVSAKTLRFELLVVKQFWDFLIAFKGSEFPIFNIVSSGKRTIF